MIQARQTSHDQPRAYKVLTKGLMREMCEELDLKDIFKCHEVWHGGVSGEVSCRHALS